MIGHTGKATLCSHLPDRRLRRHTCLPMALRTKSLGAGYALCRLSPTPHVRARVPGVYLADVRRPRASQARGIRLGHRKIVGILVYEGQPARIRVEPEVVVCPICFAEVRIILTRYPVYRSTTRPPANQERCQTILGHVLEARQILQPGGLVTHGSPEQSNILPEPPKNQERSIPRPLGDGRRHRTGHQRIRACLLISQDELSWPDEVFAGTSVQPRLGFLVRRDPTRGHKLVACFGCISAHSRLRNAIEETEVFVSY